jgi:hypothetical protein
MSLLDVLRSGVKTLDKITKPLQAMVMYQRATTNTGYGINYLAAVPLKAIVDYKAVQVRTREGTLTVSRAIITLLDVAAVKTATAGLGIGNDDIFTLPDGDTGPILDIGGFVDAGDTSLIPTTVMLG